MFRVRLQTLSRGDIAGDFRGADDAAVGILNGRDRQRDVDATAIFVHADGFEVVDPFAAFEPRDDITFFVETLRRNDQADVSAHGFGRRVAKGMFRARIPALDDAIERLADDGVVGRFDDGGQSLADSGGRLGVPTDVAGRPPEEQHEEHDFDERAEGGAELRVVEARLLSKDA